MNIKKETKEEVKNRKMLSKIIALHCFRNTYLEDIHSGIVPYTDNNFEEVRAVSDNPMAKKEYKNIPWKHLSRITDEEMKRLMIEVVNNVYTFLSVMDGSRKFKTSQWDWFVMSSGGLEDWNEPELIEDLLEKEE